MMKRLLTALLLASLARTALAQALPSALVWLPPEDFQQWSKVDALLRAKSNLRLTVALTPAMATPLAKAAMGPWADAGRLELAVRIPGDPVLAWIAAHPAAPRPSDALERTAAARTLVEKRMGRSDLGLVPGAGALDGSLTSPLAAAGTPWVLAGPYAVQGDSWAAEGRTTFVPARTVTLVMQDPAALEGAVVIDESALAESTALADLAGTRVTPAQGWATVSQLIQSRPGTRAAAMDVALWPAWDAERATLPEGTVARAAWQAYGEAAQAVARYQNSGVADIKVLEAATMLLRKAQDARFYRAADATDGQPQALPADLRSKLLAVYKRIKAPAPENLYQSAGSAAAAVSTDLPTSVRASSGPGWLSFENPMGSLARAPEGAADAAPWRLRGLRVEWDKENILFRMLLGALPNPAAAPRPLFDLYIDLNRVLGAGSMRLLDGRGSNAAARDAWEYALSATSSQASLWRSTPRGEPDELAVVKTEADATRSELKLTVPRKVLRGSPERWGYILLALAEDPERAGQKPPATQVGSDGSIVLGVLASLDMQKVLADKPGSPQRIPAVRRGP